MKIDKNNYRKHSDKNKKLINKSLKELGAGRSILLDNEDFIIAGNATFEQAEALNIQVRIIETNGKELIAVKRTDLANIDKKRKELALVDNKATDESTFDFEAINLDFEPVELGEWGFDSENDINYSGKNKELDLDTMDDTMTITLKFNEDDYNRVIQAFRRIAQSPEQAVFRLLNFDA